MTNEQLFIIIISVLSGLLGYVFGRLNISVITTNKSQSSQKSFIKNLETIDINSAKYVTNIDIDGLEKKYTTLGETKQSTDDISASVNKLKNIKR